MGARQQREASPLEVQHPKASVPWYREERLAAVEDVLQLLDEWKRNSRRVLGARIRRSKVRHDPVRVRRADPVLLLRRRRNDGLIASTRGDRLPLIYGLSTWRDFSATAMAWAQKVWADAGVTRDPEDSDYVVGVPDGQSTMLVAGLEISVELDPPLEQLIRSLLDQTTI